MFKHTARYTNFDGEKKNEDIYFHISTPEMADLEFNPTFEEDGGLGDYVKKAMTSGDNRKVYTFFKLMMANSYGRRTDDGEFMKKPEWTEKFLNSLAYEDFFIWLMSSPKNAEKFWNAIMPERMNELTAAVAEAGGISKKNINELSREDLVKMIQARIEDKGDNAPRVVEVD